MNQPEVMLPKEVAKLLRIHFVTVYRMIHRGELPHFFVGSDIRFNRSQIVAWIADQEHTQLARRRREAKRG